MRDIYIIGSKGIPAHYGGFESFVDQLTAEKSNPDIRYHVACMGEKKEEYTYHDSRCFVIPVPQIGPAKAVWYDLAAFSDCLSHIRRNHIKNPVVYVLACRIGPFTWYLKKRLAKLGGTLYVNPDGHEWMRSKWNRMIRAYWKFSEKLMVKHADLLICDSKNMERYIQETYAAYQPQTTFIAYGASVAESTLSDEDESLRQWYQKWGLQKDSYYLIVGRFVPENNYQTMIREFMASSTDKKLAIISNVEENAFYRTLQQTTGFDQDERIVFCQTVYEKELLKKIRENAYGYLHGHEVGGTNPSLLEALGSTGVNLLLDVGFNREVGEDAALYWNKEPGNLAGLLDRLETLPQEERDRLQKAAKQRIREYYSPQGIAHAYEKVFLGKRPQTVRISVAVATYNGERYLREQLDSILANLTPEDEIVIADDGSTDRTLDIIRSYQNGRIPVRLVKGPGKGIKQNIAAALAKCQGRYLFLADQDDVWTDDKVETVMQVLGKDGCKLVCHDAKVMNDDLTQVQMPSFFAYRGSCAGFWHNLLKNRYMGCCMAFDRCLLPLVLPVPDTIEMHDQWIGMLSDLTGGKNRFIRKTLLYYRRHDANVSDFSHGTIPEMVHKRFHLLGQIRRRMQRKR